MVWFCLCFLKKLLIREVVGKLIFCNRNKMMNMTDGEEEVYSSNGTI